MKRMTTGLVFLMFLAATCGAAENQRKTTNDFYNESYGAALRQQMMGTSAAQIRAEAYQRMSDRCEKFPQCIDKEETGRKRVADAFLWTPVF